MTRVRSPVPMERTVISSIAYPNLKASATAQLEGLLAATPPSIAEYIYLIE